MADTEKVVDVSITASDPDWLAEFTRRLVQDKLAACGNIIPGVRSIYSWDGAVQDDSETLVVLHTRKARVQDIIDRANQEHADDTPRVIATEAVDVHPGYRQWVIESTTDA